MRRIVTPVLLGAVCLSMSAVCAEPPSPAGTTPEQTIQNMQRYQAAGEFEKYVGCMTKRGQAALISSAAALLDIGAYHAFDPRAGTPYRAVRDKYALTDLHTRFDEWKWDACDNNILLSLIVRLGKHWWALGRRDLVHGIVDPLLRLLTYDQVAVRLFDHLGDRQPDFWREIHGLGLRGICEHAVVVKSTITGSRVDVRLSIREPVAERTPTARERALAKARAVASRFRPRLLSGTRLPDGTRPPPAAEPIEIHVFLQRIDGVWLFDGMDGS